MYHGICEAKELSNGSFVVFIEQNLTFHLSAEGFEDHANCFITNLLRRESMDLLTS